MRNKILTILSIAIVFAIGIWQFSSARIYNPIDVVSGITDGVFNTIGIGTTTPSFKLEVSDNIVANSLGLYDPRNNPLQYPAETVITNLQSGHGYTKQSAAGTQSDDTTNYVKGNQSLKLVTDGLGSAVFTRKSSISPTIDLTGKYLKVWVKVDNTNNVQDFWFYASSDNFASAYYTWKISDDITQMTKGATSTIWASVTLSFSEATVTGSPNRAAINALQWRVKDKNSTAITANWGGMSSLPEPSKGVVSITLDDGWLSQYDEARKKMDEYGFAGTAYIVPDLIGTTNYMTLQNLKDLQNQAGWNISAHHQTNFTTFTATEVEETILDIKNYLLKNGFSKGANDFAYPNGDYDETTVLPLIRKYFRSARTIASYAETYPPADYHKLRVLSVVNTTATTTIATAIDNARTNNEWLILVFHKIVTTPTVSTEYSIANFGTVIDDINSDGILVRTVSDVLDHGEESIAFTAKSNSVDIGNKNFYTLGNVGIGTSTPQSLLQLETPLNATSSYLQLDVLTSAPAAADCNSESEIGRVIMASTTEANSIWTCWGAAGWATSTKSNWNSYTPTITSESGGWTNYTATGQYRISDKMLTVFFRVYFNNTSGAAGNMYVSLPSGLTMNNTVMTGGANWDTDQAGFGVLGESGVISGVPAMIYTRTNTTVLVKYYNAAAGSYLTTINLTNTLPWTWTTQDTIDGQFTVPIL